MLVNFRSYQLSVQLYEKCLEIRLPSHLKDQLLRAASSVCLNLAEGSAKASKRDRMRFYGIAFASLREVQAVMDLEKGALGELRGRADALGAHLYRLCAS